MCPLPGVSIRRSPPWTAIAAALSSRARARSDACRAGAPCRRPAVAGRSSEPFATGSPSSLTPPCASARRASEVEIPNAPLEQRRQVHVGLRCRPLHLRHLLRQLARAVHAVELALGVAGPRPRPRSARPVPGRARAWRRAGPSSVGGSVPSSSEYQVSKRRVGNAERLAVDLPGRLGDPDVVAERLRHPPLAVGPRQDRHRQHHLLGRRRRPAGRRGASSRLNFWSVPPSSTSAFTATESYPCSSG